MRATIKYVTLSIFSALQKKKSQWDSSEDINMLIIFSRNSPICRPLPLPINAKRKVQAGLKL